MVLTPARLMMIRGGRAACDRCCYKDDASCIPPRASRSAGSGSDSRISAVADVTDRRPTTCVRTEHAGGRYLRFEHIITMIGIRPVPAESDDTRGTNTECDSAHRLDEA
jgi:hypothetical protein